VTFALTSPGGWGSNAIKQAGGPVAPRRGPARCSEAKAERYLAVSTRRPDNHEADTHVESHDDVLSDAGSTPAASTNFPQEISEVRADFPPPPTFLGRRCPEANHRRL